MSKYAADLRDAKLMCANRARNEYIWITWMPRMSTGGVTHYKAGLSISLKSRLLKYNFIYRSLNINMVRSFNIDFHD